MREETKLNCEWTNRTPPDPERTPSLLPSVLLSRKLHPGNRHPFAAHRETVWEADYPAALDFVHAEDNGRRARRLIDGLVEEQKIRSHLRYGERGAIHQQLHRDATGTSAVSKGIKHG